MKIVSTSYSKTPEYAGPQAWLNRISFYTGLLAELAKQHAVTSIERINYEGEYKQKGVDYYFINLRNKTVRFPWKMHRFIKGLHPDVVFVNGFIFPLQIIQLRITLGKCVKIIVLHRAEKPFSGIKKWLQRLADKCVNGYLFTSAEFGKEWVQKGIIINPDKIHEVIQASSHFSFQQRAMARIESGINGSPIFLWVGRLDTNKDPITVIKAFIKFLKKQPGAKLYMVYQSDELLPQVVELIQANPSASASIQLVGKIQHEKLQAWYNSADFIISSSHYEGSGIAVSEAMSCGCIPILSNIISFRKMTGPGACGLLYEPGNDKALLDALIQSMNFDIDTEQKKTLDQFQNELSFGAIAKKINLILAD